MLRFVNVATPLTAFTVFVPESVPVPVEEGSSEIWIGSVEFGERLPNRSRTSTWIAARNGLPAVTPAGWTRNVTPNEPLSFTWKGALAPFGTTTVVVSLTVRVKLPVTDVKRPFWP